MTIEMPSPVGDEKIPEGTRMIIRHQGKAAPDALWQESTFRQARRRLGLLPKQRRDYGTGEDSPFLPSKARCPRCTWINYLPQDLYHLAAKAAADPYLAKGASLWIERDFHWYLISASAVYPLSTDT
ncbi:MAG: hypothetical protein Q8P59_00510 [Dehalococcoidia bacterium]|nr:hypothetical protein [Dehalococcoidia bacterium]